MLKLRSSDSLLPKAYSLPKIHKENAPLKIIVSSLNTALYPLSQYLNKIQIIFFPPNTKEWFRIVPRSLRQDYTG